MTNYPLARRREIAAVYGAGLIQGVALVTFPAASVVFTSATGYGLSRTEYGGMFVPQAVTAIGSSLLGAGLARRLGAKRIFLIGLVANLASMALLVLSRFAMSEHAVAYVVLLVATGCLGVGFGFTVPTLNTLAAAFFPTKVDKAVLALNALLGSGTALAPMLVAVFVGLGIWWGLPVLAGALILGLLLFSARLPLSPDAQADGAGVMGGRTKLPFRFWVFAGFALLYGVCETMNGNWASLYMTKELGANATQASLALTVFWGMVTAGRVLFALVGKWLPERAVFQVLPLLVAAGFVVLAFLQPSQPLFGIPAFALAGFGCSALLPLVISFGQAELKPIAASMAGGLIASYQIGYGIAAFGVGPLESRLGLSLGTIYGATTGVALALVVLAALIARHPARLVTEVARAPIQSPTQPSTITHPGDQP
ncbi:sugar MFS transporter [Variovorax sp. J22R115]|uniref:MFS transporter n=1 Tax=Variovorax sp. J22R115 TaxID=3053509 RepID=UPI00257501C2|nr:MFS transporter [Variovorax sp. J22R115]MDM0047652.1 MFS transporter [Variovorax sp. J22R115]